MKLLKNKTHIYGFEDFNILRLNESCLDPRCTTFYAPWRFEDNNGNYIIPRDLPFRVYESDSMYHYGVEFSPELCTNHKELLPSAEKVYVHPTCKLSRSMMAEKYKKSLNPWLADAVVTPEPNYDYLGLTFNAVFVNEKAKLILMINVSSFEIQNRAISFNTGVKFVDICNAEFVDRDYNLYKKQDVLDAEFLYAGNLLYIPNSEGVVMDILTNSIPTEKIVFEKSVQESLGDETNKLDFDSLTSIKDMLNSLDNNTVAAGLKSLSMMDWMHYPNSVKYIINMCDTWKWRYNNASNSTSVKYMLSTISGSTNRRRWPGGYDSEIYEEDFELFKKLQAHYCNLEEESLANSLRYLDFIMVSSDGVMRPRLKAKD